MNTKAKEDAQVRKVTLAIVVSDRLAESGELMTHLLSGMMDLAESGGLQIVGGDEDLVAASDADFVILTRDDYARLLEDAEDRAASDAHVRTAGEERVPLEVVDRLLAGESPIRVWREHRKLTLDQLGAATGLSKGYLSDLENGKRAGPVETLQAIAAALGVGLDELAPRKG